MPKSGPEYRFEGRLRRRFEWAGCVVVKCAGSRPFDLIVMRDKVVVALELKPQGQDIRSEQREKQRALAEKAGIHLVLLRQLPAGMVSAINILDNRLSPVSYEIIDDALGKYLVQ